MADDGFVDVGMDELDEWVGGDAIFRDYTMQSNVDMARSTPIPLPDQIAILKENSGTIRAKSASIDNTLVDINAVLSATGSARFYTGDEAQKGVANREKIQTTVSTLVNSLAGLDVNTVGQAIAKYNGDLKILKKKSRLRALQNYADSFKGEVVDTWSRNTTIYPEYGTYLPSTYRDGNYIVEVTNTYLGTETQNGVTIQKYTTHYTKKIDIDYDGLISSNADTTSFLNIKKWFDDGFDKLKAKIESVGKPVPNDLINMGEEVPDEWCVWHGDVY